MTPTPHTIDDALPRPQPVTVSFDPPPPAPAVAPLPNRDHELYRRLRPLKLVSIVLLTPVFFAGAMTTFAFSDDAGALFITLPILAVAAVAHLKLRTLPPHRTLLGVRPSLWTLLAIAAYLSGLILMAVVNSTTRR